MKKRRASLSNIWFFLTIVLSLAFVFAFARQSFADIKYVDDDGVCGSNTPCYTTIQAGINAASSGDDVVVYAGTYAENITMKDGVDVENNGTDEPVIDADGTNAAVTFGGDFSTGCTLDGFDITDGGSNGGVFLQGTGAGIDNSTVVQWCDIHANTGPGIKIDGSSAATGPKIDNNEIYSNGEEGIYIVDAGSSSEDAWILNNTIRENTNEGINIAGDSYVTIGGDNIIHTNFDGIGFDTGDTDPSTKPVTIKDNEIRNNTQAGISVKDAITGKVTINQQNDIHHNGRGGINIQDSCEVEIVENSIRENIRGGIHTGTDAADPGGFSGTAGSADLTIKQNKVYGNGESSIGGGIDVRHADGTINNNLVYENHRAGIRFGDWIDEIINNTVSDNGDDNSTPADPDDDAGGGIIYDDISAGDAVNDPATGDPPAPIPIRNNICTYNYRAGIRACFTNTPGSEERDYNLVYANNATGETDCGYSTNNLGMRCANRNFGGCGGKWNPSPPPSVLMDGSNNVIADPLFANRGNDDYRLQSGPPASPAVDAGDTSYGDDVSIPPGVGTLTIDMGAYGGPDGINW